MCGANGSQRHSRRSTFRLDSLFAYCTVEFQGGLIFLESGGFSSPGAIVRVNDVDLLWTRHGPEENDWTFWGMLFLLDEDPLWETDPHAGNLIWGPGILITSPDLLENLTNEDS
jgi:hypothetical protein